MAQRPNLEEKLMMMSLEEIKALMESIQTPTEWDAEEDELSAINWWRAESWYTRNRNGESIQEIAESDVMSGEDPEFVEYMIRIWVERGFMFQADNTLLFRLVEREAQELGW